MKRLKRQLKVANPAAPAIGLLRDVRELILTTRQGVAHGVNAAMVMLHWQIGQRIRKDILNEKRAEYGEEIVATLSRQLSAEFGREAGETMSDSGHSKPATQGGMKTSHFDRRVRRRP